MIKLSAILLIAAVGAAVPPAAFADPQLTTPAPRMKGDQLPSSKHAKKHDVNGVGEPGAGSLKARVTQPAGGK